MTSKEADFASIDWEQTPYEGVSISLIDEEPDPNNPKIPRYTLMAIRIEPGSTIPLHRHKREPDWTEIITFPRGGNFEIYRIGASEIVLNDNPMVLRISAYEAFGLTNKNLLERLFFYSRMQPGFTGYEEIEEVN